MVVQYVDILNATELYILKWLKFDQLGLKYILSVLLLNPIAIYFYCSYNFDHTPPFLTDD